MTADVESLLQDVVSWGRARPDVRAVGLAGSHARGSADAGSDIDLVLLVDDVERWFADRGWAAAFGVVASTEREHWGMLESLRVRYDQGVEIEYGFSSPAWADLPLDPGTADVLQDGFRVLLDPHGILHAAVAAAR